jgi:hypothetical protein
MSYGVKNTPESFFSKVEKTDYCWNWCGVKTKLGYGQISYKGKIKYAHRLSYELLVGNIPKDKEIDHICRNRLCVNPTHMEVVTHSINMRRNDSLVGIRSRKTHCIRGHELTKENIRTYRGHRICKECRRIYKRDNRKRETI